MSAVQQISVLPEAADQRLDRWLRAQFPHLAQGRIEKMCRKGELRVDGGRVKPATRLAAGQVVRVPPLPEPDADAAPPPLAPARITAQDAEMIRACVLYRDDDIIVLNKPPGIATQGGTGQTRHIDQLADALKFDRADKPRLVHRLDRDTSGILILARHGRAAAALAKAFRARDSRKIYWALVAGVPTQPAGTIRFGLVKAPGAGGEKMQCVHPDKVESTPGARHAHTDFALIERIGSRTAWLGLSPVTGRTHQLRAHMAELGHPIVGDGKYGGRSQENPGDGWGAQIGGDLSRKLHLHARSITLTHPMTGKPMFFEAPLPEHMQHSWDLFGWNLKWAPKDPFEVFQ